MASSPCLSKQQIPLQIYEPWCFAYVYCECLLFTILEVFYLSPNISLETGNFKTSENNSQYNNKYLAVSLPFGFNYRKHRVNITFSYFPISQFENTKEEPRSNLSFRYTFSTLNNAFRISLFANDIFKQNQMQSRIYANGFNEYRKNNTDTRRVGIQLVYNFSSSNRVKKSVLLYIM